MKNKITDKEEALFFKKLDLQTLKFIQEIVIPDETNIETAIHLFKQVEQTLFEQGLLPASFQAFKILHHCPDLDRNELIAKFNQSNKKVKLVITDSKLPPSSLNNLELMLVPKKIPDELVDTLLSAAGAQWEAEMKMKVLLTMVKL